MQGDRSKLTFAGHATVRIEMDGTAILTDPLLRQRVAHLRRRSQPVTSAVSKDLDAVLISHLHYDHLDLPSLRKLGPEVGIIVPGGSGRLLLKAGIRSVQEVGVGESVQVGNLEVIAVKAEHDDRRRPFGARGDAVGFVVKGTRSIYFAGDTDIYPEMSALPGCVDGLDLSLLPVWGWGHNLGPGHMDPETAARAAALLGAKMAVPIHWGTFFPIGMKRWQKGFLERPPLQFKDHAARLAPGVEVRILEPGQSTELG